VDISQELYTCFTCLITKLGGAWWILVTH